MDTMEYYSATQRNKVLIHTIMWFNLEKIMQNKRSHTQKFKYFMTPLMRSRIGKFIVTQSTIRFITGWEEEE